MNSLNPAGKYRIMAEMNLLPLIDVSTVLLLIFMVMTPFLLKSQIKINLPKAREADATPPARQVLTVQIDRRGAILLDGQAVPADALEQRLRALVFDPGEQPLMIEADREVAFQHVVAVMDIAKRLGLVKLGINVKQEKPPRKTR